MSSACQARRPLDVNEALAQSSIQFVPVRHEQAAAFMAGVWGRLTGHAGGERRNDVEIGGDTRRIYTA